MQERPSEHEFIKLNKDGAHVIAAQLWVDIFSQEGIQ